MEANYFTILYWFCHTSTWIHHGCTHVPYPEPPSHLPPHPIPQGHPSAPALSACLMYWTWTGDLFHIWYYTCFNAILSNHPSLTFSQSPKVSSLHLCLFCCLAYSHCYHLSKFHIYALIYCIGVFLSDLTSLCIIRSSFIHLIRTDSNAFFLMAE